MEVNLTTSPSARKLQDGFVLSERYQIEKHIADGGMASVYHAKDLSGIITKDIAIKVLHQSLLSDPVHLERFIQEAKLLTQIHHPMVIDLLDVGTSGEFVYICMPYVDTPTLEQIIYSRGLPPKAHKKLIRSICEGLSAIHRMGIIHRDLKPANILVKDDYSVIITDFGIARIKESRLTSPKQKVGSLPYIAPEAWMGEPPTPALDLYALGVTMYEVITQTNPFQSELPAEVMKLHMGPLPPSPRVLNASTPAWLNDLVIWLLQRNPQYRPESAEEVISYLNEFPETDEEASVNQKSEPLVLAQNERNRPQRSKTYVLSLSGADLTAQLQSFSGGEPIPRRPRAPTVCITLPNNSAFVFEFEAPSRDIICAGILLGSLQILDGYLTSIGMNLFGIEAEGNSMLRWLMKITGPDTALLLAKGAALIVVVLLTMLVRRQRKLKGLINALCFIYIFCAIIPWMYILGSEFSKIQ
ncbi:MAG TPA: serine/threonine-protein kinase [Oligoflexia bacterium]|nr:serine/threonine-protein kinase [Oligoflexia bacterium]HMP47164.1 serine/threonine-protein kinase [Oligoflexia bacterium]